MRELLAVLAAAIVVLIMGVVLALAVLVFIVLPFVTAVGAL